MKKIICAFTIVGFLISCGGAGGSSDAASIEKGSALVASGDCMTCHRPEERLTGPGYAEIAAKYAGRPDTIITHLAGKIIHGGGGEWGEMPMLAHASITQADAELMVKYILSLKK
jgi:cytochrome c